MIVLFLAFGKIDAISFIIFTILFFLFAPRILFREDFKKENIASHKDDEISAEKRIHKLKKKRHKWIAKRNKNIRGH